jgi:hypothetical protein
MVSRFVSPMCRKKDLPHATKTVEKGKKIAFYSVFNNIELHKAFMLNEQRQ